MLVNRVAREATDYILQHTQAKAKKYNLSLYRLHKWRSVLYPIYIIFIKNGSQWLSKSNSFLFYSPNLRSVWLFFFPCWLNIWGFVLQTGGYLGKASSYSLHELVKYFIQIEENSSLTKSHNENSSVSVPFPSHKNILKQSHARAWEVTLMGANKNMFKWNNPLPPKHTHFHPSLKSLKALSWY